MHLLLHMLMGASLGELSLGKKVGRPAIWMGALIGAFPELESLLYWTHGSVQGMLHQRGPLHSLIAFLVIPPIMAWLAKSIWQNRQPKLRGRDWVRLCYAVYFCHLLLDLCTIPGIQAFYPFWKYRLSLHVISSFDPWLSIPLMLGLLMGLRYPRESRPRTIWVGSGLVLSAFYLILAFSSQQFVHSLFQASYQKHSLNIQRFEVYPTWGNTLLWYGLAEQAYGYQIGYYSLFEGLKGNIQHQYLPKQHDLPFETIDHRLEDRFQEATHRYYNFQVDSQTVLLHDLRYGWESTYLDSNQRNLTFKQSYRLWEDDDGNLQLATQAPPPMPLSWRQYGLRILGLSTE